MKKYLFYYLQVSPLVHEITRDYRRSAIRKITLMELRLKLWQLLLERGGLFLHW
jgi:hypothetical protein